MFASKDIFLKSSGGAYQISRSVRTRSSASAYFNRTFTTPTLGTKWTWSGWVKRGTLGSSQTLMAGGSSSNDFSYLGFLAGNTFTVQQFDAGVQTLAWTSTGVFRDPSAWYHVIIQYDSTQATGANRLSVWVNNTLQTGTYSAGPIAQNTLSRINTATTHYINRYFSAANYFDGYFAEANFIDGQALTPSSFGETNAITGVWQPKAYSGTYGTNGFYLNFSDNSTAAALGTDFSGNSNTWTVNNISVTAGVTYDSMLDVPTLYADGGNGRGNYCVLNPLDGNNATLSGANLNFVTLSTGAANTLGSIYVSTGKWYWEQVATSNGQYALYGIRNGPSGYYVNYYGDNGNKNINGTASAYGATFGNNDVIGVALDMDAGTITFYKNNASQGAITIGNSGPFAAWVADGASGISVTGSINFGQRPFTYTPPTGFVALNTQNLPTPTISNGANYMAATTYTGTLVSNAVSNAVNGVSFQPDLVWIKSRSAATDHELTDSVRGVTLSLTSNSTAAEATDLQGLTAFNSGGFTVGTNTTYNNLAATYVGWQWNAGGSTVTNTSGTISAQVRANPTAGFSVVTYTGVGGVSTIGHGLGVAPSFFVVKNRTQASDWECYFATLGNTTRIVLNSTAAQVTGVNGWNSTSPTSTVFTVNGGTAGNTAGNNHLAYCFAAVAGYSAFGSYTGNGSADGPFVYLGFRPRFVIIKRTDAGNNWHSYNSSSDPSNVVAKTIYPNLANAEATENDLDFVSNGMKMRDTGTHTNASGGTYIYMAWAENPFKNSLAR